MNILKLLRAPEPASADLRAEMAGLDVGRAAKAISELQARRRTMLLDGETGPALDGVERDIVEAQREHDRTVALGEELRERLTAAEARERIDALLKRKGAAEAETRSLAELVDGEVPGIVALLNNLVRRRQASDVECEAVDRLLAEIGSTDRVERARPKTREPDPIGVARLTLGPQLSGHEGGAR